MALEHPFGRVTQPLVAVSLAGCANSALVLSASLDPVGSGDPHGAELAAVIRAVVDGTLAPAGCTTRFRGITGYLFRSEDLRKYRPVPDMTAPPEGFLNYREAAALLGVRTNVIRGLADQGMLTASDGFRNGFARLIPAKEVQQFAEQYVATSILAKRFSLNSGSLSRYLRESGTPLLAITLAEAGRCHAFFLRKDVVAQLQIPTRRMLREQAHHRIMAARKRKWVEYRQAKEAALGKPMRRVRSNCSHSSDSPITAKRRPFSVSRERDIVINREGPPSGTFCNHG